MFSDGLNVFVPGTLIEYVFKFDIGFDDVNHPGTQLGHWESVFRALVDHKHCHIWCYRCLDSSSHCIREECRLEPLDPIADLKTAILAGVLDDASQCARTMARQNDWLCPEMERCLWHQMVLCSGTTQEVWHYGSHRTERNRHQRP